nr:NADH:ubiquinone reductase (Na(+)-transporting) subunit A [Paludibacter sp.]
QINKINPVNKSEVVWTVGAEDVLFIGRLFSKGIVDLTRTVAITGPEVVKPQYIQTVAGSLVAPLLKGNVTMGVEHRVISGNVLSGLQISANGNIDPYATQISVIKEGKDNHELVGWAMPRFNKFSASRLYFSSILQKVFGKKDFEYDARVLGGERAIIMSGEYDKVLPMDILPEFLFKAMMTGNIDKMEALGAYEIAPEDVALCEFVCTSKLPLQQIVRESLDNMRKELE